MRWWSDSAPDSGLTRPADRYRLAVEPTQVPGVTALEPIGRGAYSAVYRGVADGREVAVKVGNLVAGAPPAPTFGGHPYVVPVYAAGLTADGRPYLVMELCAGSYADVLEEQGVRPVAEVLAVGAKVADALAAAHRAGVLHGDVKPGNILVTAGGEPRLADFGAAPGETLTPAYAAPELFRGASLTAAADLYSLGATLYALLAGRPPHWPEVGTRSVAAVLRPDEPVADVPGVPPELAEVLRRATAVDPEDRYGSMAELRDALSGPGAPAARGRG
jgi:serine/threonine protein kinase